MEFQADSVEDLMFEDDPKFLITAPDEESMRLISDNLLDTKDSLSLQDLSILREGDSGRQMSPPIEQEPSESLAVFREECLP